MSATNPAEVFPCYEPGCDREFQSERALGMHKMRVHSNDPRWTHGARLGQQRAAESKRSAATERRARRRAEQIVPAEPETHEIVEVVQPGASGPAQVREMREVREPKWSYGTPIPCVICGKMITEARMRSHLRRVHHAVVPDRPARTRVLPRVPTSTTRATPPGFVQNPEWVRPDEIREEVNFDDIEETVEVDEVEEVDEVVQPADISLGSFRVIGEDGDTLILVADGVYWKLERISK